LFGPGVLCAAGWDERPGASRDSSGAFIAGIAGVEPTIGGCSDTKRGSEQDEEVDATRVVFFDQFFLKARIESNVIPPLGACFGRFPILVIDELGLRTPKGDSSSAGLEDQL
jgi:hypothetical protein